MLEAWESGKKLSFLPRPCTSTDSSIRLVAFAYPGAFAIVLGPEGHFASETRVLRNPAGRRGSAERTLKHPGNPGLLASVRPYQAPDYVYLPELSSEASGYWINAPGTQWALVAAEMTKSEEPLVVDLKAGCSVQIRIRGFTPKRGLMLHVLQEGGPIAAYKHLGLDWIELTGLPAGSTEVLLSFDGFPGRSSSLAISEPFDLQPAGTALVMLDMPALPGPDQLGSIRGVLTIEAPELWSDLKAYRSLAILLSQEPPSPGYLALPGSTRWLTLDHMNHLLDSKGIAMWEWEMLTVPAGVYAIQTYPIGQEVELVVNAGQETSMNLSIAPVARTLIDAMHGGEACPDALLFDASPTASTSSNGLHVEPSKEQGDSAFTMVSLPGDIALLAVVPGLPPTTREFTVLPGWNAVQVDIPVAPGFELVAVDSSGAALSFDSWFDLEVVAVGGSGQLLDRYVQDLRDPDSGVTRQAAVFFVSEPGDYEVTCPAGIKSSIDLPAVIRVAEAPARSRYQVVVAPSSE